MLLRLLGRRSCRRRGSLIPGSLSILVAEPDSDPTCEKSLRAQESSRAQHLSMSSQYSSTSGPTAELSGGLRYFSGANEDGKEYKRWKLGVVNKLLTLDKLPAEAKGAFVFTLLTSKALEAVEHLDLSLYQCADGERAIFKILDKRFPQKDSSDELAEVLNDIFSMRVKDCERLGQCVSRATEMFEKCERKSGHKFPEEARGYMFLKWSD